MLKVTRGKWPSHRIGSTAPHPCSSPPLNLSRLPHLQDEENTCLKARLEAPWSSGTLPPLGVGSGLLMKC